VSDEQRPRRSGRHKKPAEAEATAPGGYRATRRSGKTGKKVRRAQAVGRVQDAFSSLVARVGRVLAVLIAAAIAGVLVVAFVLAAVNGINAFARWNARRAAEDVARAQAKEKVRGNLLVIATQEKQATGFIAMRVDEKNQRVFGIAIPDGAFVEVPGQGFERVGDSFKAGPDVSLAAVSNYLGVPFDYYVTIDDAVYKAMIKDQDVTQLMPAVVDTNLEPPVRAEVTAQLKAVPGKNVGLAPLPVRAVNIGNVTYYEPQRDQIADLLYSWWGVKFGEGKQQARVIVYNGAGEPGIGGVAARALIKAGFRVVDTGNADRFDYKTTRVVLLRGDAAVAQRVQDILGCGEVVSKAAEQDITDVIVIVGRDYMPGK
jgi:hypothetical protein